MRNSVFEPLTRQLPFVARSVPYGRQERVPRRHIRLMEHGRATGTAGVELLKVAAIPACRWVQRILDRVEVVRRALQSVIIDQY